MEHRTQQADGDRPGGGDLRPGAAPSSAGAGGATETSGARATSDALDRAAAQLAGLEAAASARGVLAEILTATLAAATSTRSTRDPLADTAPDSAEEALAVFAGLDHLRSSLAALDASWQVEAERRITRSDADRDVPASRRGKGASHEIALARRVSPSAGSYSLASARRLVAQLPGTSSVLRSGRLTAEQASTVATTLDGASPETCARIDRLIAEAPEALQGRGRRRLASDLRAMIQQLEPDGSRDRAERTARARHVTMTPLADGMARLSAVLPGLDATAMMQTLEARAASQRAAGSRTPARALEADLLVEAVLRAETTGQDPSAPTPRPRLDLGIVITDTALLGRGDESECALLEGYGTIPAHVITDTLQGRPPGTIVGSPEEHPDHEAAAVFRQLYRSPRSGQLVAMESRARTFPVGLSRLIRLRDVTCRTPWCNAVIRQIDHVLPHHRGGPTSLENGQGLCVRCNLAKELGLWEVTPLEEGPTGTGRPGGHRWTSPHGAVGCSSPPSVGPPIIPAAEGSDPPAPRDRGDAAA